MYFQPRSKSTEDQIYLFVQNKLSMCGQMYPHGVGRVQDQGQIGNFILKLSRILKVLGPTMLFKNL